MLAPTGHVALVFLDVESAPEVRELLGEGRADFEARYDALVRDRLAACHGYEVKSGGGSFMLAFASAGDALAFAVGAQEDLASLPWPAGVAASPARFGIHAGDPLCEPDPGSGRMDYFGPVVNRAARVLAAGHGGQILISGAARADAGPAAAGSEETDLGEHRLRGFDQAERIVQILAPSQRARRFPPLSTVAATLTNLPAQTSSFVGRAEELAGLCRMVAQEGAPLVVLTGTAGCGKTRLAVRAASDLLEAFPGGAWFAELSEARDPRAVAEAVASALGVSTRGADGPVAAVGEALRLRRPLLLVLDTFDPVAAHAAATIGAWRERAPHARFLVTSRSRIDLPGSRELRVEPLPAPPAPLPGEAADVRSTVGYEAVRLFVDRAREAKPDFAVAEDNAADVAAICRELEGLPLAIELAAARVKILAPATMVKKLGQKFQLLRSARQDSGRRQQTLVGAIDWSYEMLSGWERSALHQASVFHEGFLGGAAEAVIDLSGVPGAPAPLEAVRALVSRGLVAVADSPGGARFAIYRPIREFAEAKWREAASPEERAALEGRHAAHYVAWAESCEERRHGHGGLEAAAQLEREIPNVLAAHDRARDPALSARALLAIHSLLEQRSALSLDTVRMERSLAALEAVPGHDRALAARLASRFGLTLLRKDGSAGGIERIDRALGVARACGEPYALAVVLRERATADWEIGGYSQALVLFEEAAAAARACGSELELARCINSRGACNLWMDRFPEAIRSFEEALVIFRRIGERYGEVSTSGNLGIVLKETGRVDEALLRYEEVERDAAEIGAAALLATTLSNHAIALSDRGRVADAVRMFARVEELHRQQGDKGGLARNLANRGVLLMRENRHREALRLLDRAHPLFQEMKDRQSAAMNLRNMGDCLRMTADREGALAKYREAGTEHAAMHDGGGVADADACAGRLLAETGSAAEGAGLLRRAVRAFRELGMNRTHAYFNAIAALAVAEDGLGNAADAVPLARETLELAESLRLELSISAEWNASMLSHARRIAGA